MNNLKDKRYAAKRAKKWDRLGFIYRHIHYLSKNHSLNCGCSMCRARTFYKRYENKQDRLKSRNEISNTFP